MCGGGGGGGGGRRSYFFLLFVVKIMKRKVAVSNFYVFLRLGR